MTIEELKEILIKNFVNADGNLDISNLDFSDFHGDVYLDNLQIYGDLYQRYQEIGGNLNQSQQQIGGRFISKLSNNQ